MDIKIISPISITLPEAMTERMTERITAVSIKISRTILKNDIMKISNKMVFGIFTVRITMAVLQQSSIRIIVSMILTAFKNYLMICFH